LSLIGCSPFRLTTSKIVKTEYVSPELQEVPEEPSYYRIEFFKTNGSYCLDPENAKNLLKNIELMRGYCSELRLILENLKGEGGK
jgi:hypothetical protein